MRVARPTSSAKSLGSAAKNFGSVDVGAAQSHSPPLQQRNPEEAAQPLTILLPTADTYRSRAEEAKSLARKCQDVWEREILLRVATQWQLLAAHRDVKESRQHPVGGGVKRA